MSHNFYCLLVCGKFGKMHKVVCLSKILHNGENECVPIEVC